MAQPNLPQYKLSTLPGQVVQSITSLSAGLADAMKTMGTKIAEKKKKDEAAEAKALDNSYTLETNVANAATNANTDFNAALTAWGSKEALAQSNKDILAYGSGGNMQLKQDANNQKLVNNTLVTDVATYSNLSTENQNTYKQHLSNVKLSGSNSIGTLADDANFLAESDISEAQVFGTNTATNIAFETLRNNTLQLSYNDGTTRQTRNITASNAKFKQNGRKLDYYQIKSENAIGNWSTKTYNDKKREGLFDNFKEKITFKDQSDGTWKTKVTVKSDGIMAAAADKNSNIYKSLKDDINSNASNFFQTYATMRKEGLISDDESLGAPWSITEVSDDKWKNYTQGIDKNKAKGIDTNKDNIISRDEFKEYQMGLAVKGLATKYSQIYGDLQKVEAVQEKEVEARTGGYRPQVLTKYKTQLPTYQGHETTVNNLFSNITTTQEASKAFADGMTKGSQVQKPGSKMKYMTGADIKTQYGGTGGKLNNAITSGKLLLSNDKVYVFDTGGGINPNTLPVEYGGYDPTLVEFENGVIKDPSTLTSIILDAGYGYDYDAQYLMGTKAGRKKLDGI